MIAGIILSLLAFIAVIIGVLSGVANDLRAKHWKALNFWAYAGISIGLLVTVFSIIKSIDDARSEQKLLTQVSTLKARLEKEESRIGSKDFSIRVLVDYRSPPDGSFPEVVAVTGGIGKAHYIGELI
jgi:membrane protein implicated in regulation of membrane protease activity